MLVNEPPTLPNLEPTTYAWNVDAMRVLDGRRVVVLVQLYGAAQVVLVIDEIDAIGQHRRYFPVR